MPPRRLIAAGAIQRSVDKPREHQEPRRPRDGKARRRGNSTDGVDALSRRHRDVPRWCLAIVDHPRGRCIHMEEVGPSSGSTNGSVAYRRKLRRGKSSGFLAYQPPHGGHGGVRQGPPLGAGETLALRYEVRLVPSGVRRARMSAVMAPGTAGPHSVAGQGGEIGERIPRRCSRRPGRARSGATSRSASVTCTGRFQRGRPRMWPLGTRSLWNCC